MIRIRGQVGEWPVDLSIEMDDQDWAQLAKQLPQRVVTQAAAASDAAAPAATLAAAPAAESPDSLWASAQQVLKDAGSMDGPQLLAELEALSGSAAAGKRLLVRLRHSAQVRVHSDADAPVYSWSSETS